MGLLISKGHVVLPSTPNHDAVISIDDQLLEIPEFLYLFWEQFQSAVDYPAAEKSFSEYGFDKELFTETVEILMELGLISQY